MPAPATPPGSTPAAQGSTGPLGLHSDLRFSVLAPPRKEVSADDAAYQAQVHRIAARLQAAAQAAYPEQSARIGTFDVFVADAGELSARSSGTGKIAVNAGFARLKPADPWLAFVIAREMGHILAGHHDSNAGASIAVSLLMNLVVPGSGLLKSALAFGGSEIASGSRREKQAEEADQAAMKLLAAAGYRSTVVARSVRLKPLADEEQGSWAVQFRASAARLAADPAPALIAARSGPRPQSGAAARKSMARAEAGRPAALAAVSYVPSQRDAGTCASCFAQP